MMYADLAMWWNVEKQKSANTHTINTRKFDSQATKENGQHQYEEQFVYITIFSLIVVTCGRFNIAGSDTTNHYLAPEMKIDDS